MERLTGSDGAAVQVSGAEGKRARPIGQTTGARAYRGWLKQTGVGTLDACLANAGARTLGAASDTAKDQAERAAEYVCGLAGGKEDGLERDKRKPKGIEAKLQCLDSTPTPGTGFSPDCSHDDLARALVPAAPRLISVLPCESIH